MYCEILVFECFCFWLEFDFGFGQVLLGEVFIWICFVCWCNVGMFDNFGGWDFELFEDVLIQFDQCCYLGFWEWWQGVICLWLVMVVINDFDFD